jgi:exodeoxyribonuclease VII large subunit
LLDHATVLAKGWSITRTSSGTIVRSISDVAQGDTLVTTLIDGQVTSTVEEVV